MKKDCTKLLQNKQMDILSKWRTFKRIQVMKYLKSYMILKNTTSQRKAKSGFRRY